MFGQHFLFMPSFYCFLFWQYRYLVDIRARGIFYKEIKSLNNMTISNHNL